MQTLDTLQMLQICGMVVSSGLAMWKQLEMIRLLSQTNAIHEIHYENIAKRQILYFEQCAEYFY
jgi:hypothetical protein